MQEKTAGGIATGPRDVIYEPLSGNLIVAMESQGVVVGTPDGKWTRYGVGDYTPMDFSFSGKTRLLLSDVDFWIVALALSLSLTGAALIYSQYGAEGSKLLAFTRITISATSVVASAAMLFLFGDSIAGDVPDSFNRLPVPAFILGALAVASSLLRPRYWLKVGASFGGMIALIVLLFMLWLHLGITLGLAMASAVVLTALGAFLLGHHVKTAEYRNWSVSAYSARFTRRQTVDSGQFLCRRCQRPNNPLARDCNSCGLPLGNET